MNKKRLDSWKSIAAFLGRSLRTVQRWHECNGLPVHHFGGHKGSVFAYEEEIDQWLLNVAAGADPAQERVEETLESGKRSSSQLTATASGMWETRSERNIHAIADLYRKAIADDSSNSAAYAGLAKAILYCSIYDMMDGSMAYPCALEALRRMPQIDAEHLDTKCSAAWIDLLYNRNWRQARAGFEEILSKRPDSFALAGMAALQIAESTTLKAQDYAWEAWRLNPLVSSLGGMLGWAVYLNGDFQNVLDLITQIRHGGGDSAFLTAIEALALVQEGPASRNLVRIEKAASDFPQNHALQGILGYACGISGDKARAQNLYAHLVRQSETNRKSNGYARAIISIGLGNNKGAIEGLENAYAEGSLWSLGFRSDPMLKPLAGDPRFMRLANKIGSTVQYCAEMEFQEPPTRSFLESALVGDIL